MRTLLKSFSVFILLLTAASHLMAQSNLKDNEALYRPSMHFTPLKGWMNDPNGMFYKDGVYHLYYQHYPNATVWGPMHWGHATSKDLKNWKHEPIALYPDSIGMIFSGSAVVDEKNTSGFGENGKAPIVAIFTQHNMDREKAGRVDAQNQSIAYSNDNGYTWKKYTGNPVIKNPGINDFRDPKVIWHEDTKKWIMTLAVKNKVSFYSSPNLKEWTKESDFGENVGSHDGVWECPDLFPLQYNNKTYWVLTSSINPGGPNKGSATQYFIGEFNGHTFTSNSSKTKWMDYGADNYAGVTFSNTGEKRISIGWMSNWLYAQQVPTMQWRSALTTPRVLHLQVVDREYYLCSFPIESKAELMPKIINKKNTTVIASNPFALNIVNPNLSSFTVTLSNNAGAHLDFGYDSATKQYFIDRTFAGLHDFHTGFATKHFAPRISNNTKQFMNLIIDKTSIEMFGDNGLTVMTDIFFPTEPYTHISVKSSDVKFKLAKFRFYDLAP